MNGGFSQRSYRRQLLSMGVEEKQAERIAADQYADAQSDPLRCSLPGDQRVMPHERGWIVTRMLEAEGAEFFERLADAERHARQVARSRRPAGILIYDADGRALLHIGFPRWRSRL